MRNLELRITDVVDPVARHNFDRIQQLSDEDMFAKFKGKHFEIVATKNQTYTFLHKLGFAPKDVIQTSVRTPGTATLVWNYNAFTRTAVSFTVASLGVGESLTFRAFIGSYTEQ